MLRPIVLIVAALMLLGGASAQDDAPRLRVPTPEEYLNTVLSLDYGPDNVEQMSRLVLLEISQRYEEQLPTLDYELLSAAFNTLFGSGSYGYALLPDQNIWENARVIAWLRENEINLAQHEHLHFDDYDVLTTSVDFSGDGTPEYILDVVRGSCFEETPCSRAVGIGPQYLYQALLVAVQDAPGQHRLIPTPLFWLSSEYHYTWAASGIMQSLKLEDITGDGIPEWWVANTSSYSNDTPARLYFLGWRDDALVDLASPPIMRRVQFGGGPPDITKWPITFTGEGTFDVHYEYTDNWNCIRGEIIVYQWNAVAG